MNHICSKHGAAFVLYALMDPWSTGIFQSWTDWSPSWKQIEEQIFKKNTARSNIVALYD